MSAPKCLNPFRTFSLVLIVLCAAALGGCDLWAMLTGGVQFNKVIEDELTYTDEHSTDSNDYVFYWDYYEVKLDEGKSYSLELWADPEAPIHFECDLLGEDLCTWSDGNQSHDGYLLYDIPSSFTGKLGFDFYVRADYVGADSWYQFRINEQ